LRRILVSSLILSSFALTAAAATGKSANDAAASNTPSVRPVSTGVTAPVLVRSPHIEIPASDVPSTYPNLSEVILKVNLDADGIPNDVQVVHPLTPQVDDRIVAAVRELRWTPALLDNQKIPINLNLVVQVQR
jgi:hypothetical protein